jgi:hypothetical protein
MVHVYDPTGILLEDRMLLYVDGVRQTLEIIFKGGIPSDFSNFNVPMVLAAVNHRGVIRDHLNGCLDEVAFYTLPLSEEEVRSHFKAAVPDVFGCIKLFGKPLANVEVHLNQKPEKVTTLTDINGCFGLNLPGDGKFDIKVKCPPELLE